MGEPVAGIRGGFPAFREVSPNRLREATGLPFDCFAAGQVFHHRPGLTLSQQDNVDEALLTLNQAMVHFDDTYAAQTEFGRPLIVSTLTLQKAIGLSWKTFGRRKRIMQFASIRMTRPLFGGDTIYVRTHVLAVSPDPDDAQCGLLDCRAVVTRHDGVEVAEIVYSQSVRRGFAPVEPPAQERCLHLPLSHVEIDSNTFVETIGIEFDALVPGLCIEHRPGFPCSWQAARLRGILSGDHGRALTEPEASDCAMPETWLLSMLTAATTRAFGRVAANLAWEGVGFTSPAWEGEMIFAESRVLGRRASASRPDQGVLHVSTRGLTQDGREVCRFERKLLVYQHAGAAHQASGYA